MEFDVTAFEPTRSYAVWHDRAVFHFLTGAAERKQYFAVLRKALQTRGHFLLATFGPDGPHRCSGLEVQRYSLQQLEELLGPEFRLRAHEIEEHQTPTGSSQQFLYSWWQAKA